MFEIRNLTYRYADVTALDDISLTIPQGQRVVILGANGSGKSTLLRILDALVFPASGSIAFNGTPLSEEKFADEKFDFDFRRRVAFVFQNPDVQLFNPTVFDEVAFGPLQLRWPKDEIIARVDKALQEMEIAHLKNRAPHRLSGGEKKRVALASVLVMDPDVLLLDEPTASLDPESQSHIIDYLVGCSGTKTIITATHNLEIVEDIADRCIIFESGRIAAQGTPAEILGDEALLRRTRLLFAHRHKHDHGLMHAHAHLHRHHRHHE